VTFGKEALVFRDSLRLPENGFTGGLSRIKKAVDELSN
jgi:hypothetical protein